MLTMDSYRLIYSTLRIKPQVIYFYFHKCEVLTKSTRDKLDGMVYNVYHVDIQSNPSYLNSRIITLHF
jgi:hypothetical protein